MPSLSLSGFGRKWLPPTAVFPRAQSILKSWMYFKFLALLIATLLRREDLIHTWTSCHRLGLRVCVHNWSSVITCRGKPRILRCSRRNRQCATTLGYDTSAIMFALVAAFPLGSCLAALGWHPSVWTLVRWHDCSSVKTQWEPAELAKCRENKFWRPSRFDGFVIPSPCY